MVSRGEVHLSPGDGTPRGRSLEHRVVVKAMKSHGQWEGKCDQCSFWTGMSGLSSEVERKIRETAAWHEEQMAKKEAAKAKRRVQR
jgi:hypothetical protein